MCSHCSFSSWCSSMLGVTIGSVVSCRLSYWFFSRIWPRVSVQNRLLGSKHDWCRCIICMISSVACSRHRRSHRSKLWALPYIWVTSKAVASFVYVSHVRPIASDHVLSSLVQTIMHTTTADTCRMPGVEGAWIAPLRNVSGGLSCLSAFKIHRLSI